MLDRIVRSRLFWIAWFALLGWLAFKDAVARASGQMEENT